MTKNEEIFRLLGGRIVEMDWVDQHGSIFEEPPDVSNNYELCRKYIMPKMRKRGWGYQITYDVFLWVLVGERRRLPLEYKDYPIKIKDDNIAAALVEAAIEVLKAEGE